MASLNDFEKWSPEYKRLYYKRRKQTRRRLGRCVECNAQANGKFRCLRCAEMASKRASVRVYERRANRVCTRCQKAMDRDGWTCISCTEKGRLETKKMRERRKENHQCIQCGDDLDLTAKEKESGKGYRCENCLDRRRLNAKR